MNVKDDGGPAFPFDEKMADGTHYHDHPGMTLRDHFAGQALMGLVAFDRPTNGDNQPHHFASWSYALADAMLA
ncbi:hypothetical protein EHH54_41770, partial [Rhizobium leguminosarum]